MASTYYITAAIPYVNAKPHLGHLMEWFQADSLARFYRLAGYDVAFTCGTDENSLKNVQAAEKAGKSPQAWLDEYAEIFKDSFTHFGISLTHFRRGSDQTKHWPGVQQLWELCNQSGDIYKKTYTGLYCVGCESFYTAEELTSDGLCPEHLKAPEKVTEENYFFKLSKYQKKIRDLIATNQLYIVSEQYKKEMLGFIDQGLEDFSISRSTERARGVGVPVPHDPSQVMYVWFDALAIYMTAIGWGYDQAEWQKYWPADTHVIGKGINRFHSVYWIGMLLSAGLALPKSVSVHGYITVDNQKMSKSLGNVVDPYELVEKYGLEPVRYYLLRYISSHADGDFSYNKFEERYTADLANGLGNLCSRVATLCAKNELQVPDIIIKHAHDVLPLTISVDNVTQQSKLYAHLKEYDISNALELIFHRVGSTDQLLSEKKPWELPPEQAEAILISCIKNIISIARMLQPFMPATADTILSHFSQSHIAKLQPLFPRLLKQ